MSHSFSKHYLEHQANKGDEGEIGASTIPPSDKLVLQIFKIKCKGRDPQGREVLAEPVDVTVLVRGLEDEKTIALSVKCPYNTGSYRKRCRASHPEVEKRGDGVVCPYTVHIN